MAIPFPFVARLCATLGVSLLLATAAAQPAREPPEPYVGQPGKDVIWVPSPLSTVEKMLDMARVGPRDYVIDLGSGDGRNVIEAAKRGARALGVEYNADLVALSARNAAAAGVADRARFVQGDMFEADISQATVLALFLLPDNLSKLSAKFLALPPGTRIVTNGYRIYDWDVYDSGLAEGDCDNWCTVYLYLVPARAAGTWRFPAGELRLEQKFTRVSGKLVSGRSETPLSDGRMEAERISFRLGEAQFAGEVRGDTLSVVNRRTGERWSGVRTRAKR
jgi:SAM-dependent methyltransferase